MISAIIPAIRRAYNAAFTRERYEAMVRGLDLDEGGTSSSCRRKVMMLKSVATSCRCRGESSTHVAVMPAGEPKLPGVQP